MSVYGDHTRICRAKKGRYAASVDMTDANYLLLRITPRAILSAERLRVWFMDLPTPTLEVDLDSVSLYQIDMTDATVGGWPPRRLKTYLQEQIMEMVVSLHNLEKDSFN